MAHLLGPNLYERAIQSNARGRNVVSISGKCKGERPGHGIPLALSVNHLKPLLKIALDVHLAWYVMVLQEQGSSPKPPQRFKPGDFLKWIKQKVTAGYRVVTCYEAGPFGYTLHRQLTALGVTNDVIRPRNWDDQYTRVKTDRTDALAMLNALDRFCAGNEKALALVPVPTETQERQRTQTRLRQSLVRDLKMIAGRGRGLALQYGFRLKGTW
jgi:transposase